MQALRARCAGWGSAEQSAMLSSSCMECSACWCGDAGYKVKDDSNAVTARKVVQLYQLPRILVLHLKRFSYTLNGTGKIHKTINYPERLRCAASDLVPDAYRLNMQQCLAKAITSADYPAKKTISVTCHLTSAKCEVDHLDGKQDLRNPQYITEVLHLEGG